MKQKHKFHFILASASPRRRQILKAAHYRFTIVPSHVSETNPQGLNPAQLVKHLALKKALAIARKHPPAVVLGADTLVFLGQQVIGKPQNKVHAAKILRQLSGHWQRVYTGVAVVSAGGRWKRAGAAVSYVKFRKLTEEDIRCASHRHLDKAGAYSVQEKKDDFVEKIRGDYDNVVGLPMRLVKKLFRSLKQDSSQNVGKRFRPSVKS